MFVCKLKYNYERKAEVKGESFDSIQPLRVYLLIPAPE